MHQPLHTGASDNLGDHVIERCFQLPSAGGKKDKKAGTELTQRLIRVPQGPSGFTEDNGEIYMDAREVQLYNSLKGHRGNLNDLQQQLN